jgi:hypothetical protein
MLPHNLTRNKTIKTQELQFIARSTTVLSSISVTHHPRSKRKVNHKISLPKQISQPFRQPAVEFLTSPTLSNTLQSHNNPSPPASPLTSFIKYSPRHRILLQARTLLPYFRSTPRYRLCSEISPLLARTSFSNINHHDRLYISSH